MGERALGNVPCQGAALQQLHQTCCLEKKATVFLKVETGVSVGAHLCCAPPLCVTGQGTALCTALSPLVEATLPATFDFHNHPCVIDGQKLGAINTLSPCSSLRSCCCQAGDRPRGWRGFGAGAFLHHCRSPGLPVSPGAPVLRNAGCD